MKKIKELNNWTLENLIKRNGILSILEDDELEGPRDKIESFIKNKKEISESVSNYLKALKYMKHNNSYGFLHDTLRSELILECTNSENFELKKLVLLNKRLAKFELNFKDYIEKIRKYYSLLKYLNNSNSTFMKACSSWVRANISFTGVDGNMFDDMINFDMFDLINNLDLPFNIEELKTYEDEKYKLTTDEEKLDVVGDSFIDEEIKTGIEGFLIDYYDYLDDEGCFEDMLCEYFSENVFLSYFVQDKIHFESERKLYGVEKKILQKLIEVRYDLKVVTVSFESGILEKVINDIEIKKGLISKVRMLLQFAFYGVVGISNGFVSNNKLIFIVMKDLEEIDRLEQLNIEDYIEGKLEDTSLITSVIDDLNKLLRSLEGRI